MAVRRSAFERVGGFDEELPIYGDEEEWRPACAPTAARVDLPRRRRARPPPRGRRRPPALARPRRVPARPRRAAQRPPQGRGAPAGAGSCATSRARAGTRSRRALPAGADHGRPLRRPARRGAAAAVTRAARPHGATCSGDAGQIVGPRLRTRATLADLALNARAALARTGRRLDRLATARPAGRCWSSPIYRPGSRLPRAVEKLRSARHDVRFAFGATAREADPALAADTAAHRARRAASSRTSTGCWRPGAGSRTG